MNSSNQFKWLIYTGRSMRPTFNDYDLIKVDRRAVIGRGDVIVFRPTAKPDRLVVHRVVKVLKDGYITRGDNNRQSDPLVVTTDEIVGLVIERRRGDSVRLVRRGFGGYLSAGGWQLFKQFRRLSSRHSPSASSVNFPANECIPEKIATATAEDSTGNNAPPSTGDKVKEYIRTVLFTGKK